jgi:hypothetical protein
VWGAYSSVRPALSTDAPASAPANMASTSSDSMAPRVMAEYYDAVKMNEVDRCAAPMEALRCTPDSTVCNTRIFTPATKCAALFA